MLYTYCYMLHACLEPGVFLLERVRGFALRYFGLCFAVLWPVLRGTLARAPRYLGPCSAVRPWAEVEQSLRGEGGYLVFLYYLCTHNQNNNHH